MSQINLIHFITRFPTQVGISLTTVRPGNLSPFHLTLPGSRGSSAWAKSRLTPVCCRQGPEGIAENSELFLASASRAWHIVFELDEEETGNRPAILFEAL